MEWKKNLYQYEEQPPVHVWDLVARELESDVPEVRNILIDLEAALPANAWENIAADIHTKVPVRSITPWYRKPWNIAAAATTAAVLWGTIYLRNPKDPISPAEISTSVFKPAPRPEMNDVASIPAVPQPVLEANITPGIARAKIEQTQSGNNPKAAKKTQRVKDHNYN
jgi:hypothetical protein